MAFFNVHVCIHQWMMLISVASRTKSICEWMKTSKSLATCTCSSLLLVGINSYKLIKDDIFQGQQSLCNFQRAGMSASLPVRETFQVLEPSLKPQGGEICYVQSTQQCCLHTKQCAPEGWGRSQERRRIEFCSICGQLS